MSAHAPQNQSRPFISYAREDRAFVHQLSEALKAAGCEPWVDWEIDYAVPWMAELEQAIDAASAFIFVISPDSIASEICQREIDYAVAQKKRLIPILHRTVDTELVPQAMRGINWIDAREQADAALAESILHVMNTDFDWVNAHSRLLVQSREWESGGHDNSLLLSGSALKRAERWLARSESLEPGVTPLQMAYLIASRKRQTAFSRGLLISVTAALLVTIVLAIYAMSQTRRAETQRNIAQSRLLAARATDRIYSSEPHLDQALLLAVLSQQVSPTAEARQSLYRALKAVPRIHRFESTEETIVSVALSPDDHTIAIGDFKGYVSLWDTDVAGRKARFQIGSGAIQAVSFSPDGNRLAVAMHDGIYLVSPESSDVEKLPVEGRYSYIHWHPDGRLLFSSNDAIVVWDTSAGQILARMVIPGQRGIDTVAASDDGTIVAAVGNWSSEIRLLDLDSEAVSRSLSVHDSFVRALAFSPHGSRLASGSENGEIFVWDVASRRRLNSLQGFVGRVDLVRFSPDGRKLLAGGLNRVLYVWDLESGQTTEYLYGHTNGLMDAVFSRDGNILISVAFESTFIVWDMGVSKYGAIYAGHHADASVIAVSPDGKRVASGAEDGAVRLWDVASGEMTTLWDSHPEEIQAMTFSREGDALIWAADEKIVNVWDLGRGAVLYRLDADGPVLGLAASPDGKMLAVGANYRSSIGLWDLSSGASIGELADPDVAVNPEGLVFSPDGRLLLTAGDSGVHLWDITRGKLVEQLTDALAVEATFSPDGEWVAASFLALCKVIAWPLDNADAYVMIDRRDGCAPPQIAFSPDGQMLAITAGEIQDDIELWDHRTGTLLATLEEQGTIEDLAFLPDGRIVTSHTGGPLRVWATDIDGWAERACDIANRNLDEREWADIVGDSLPYRNICRISASPDQ